MSFKMVVDASAPAPKLSVSISKIDKVLPEEKREEHVYFLTNLDQNVAVTMKTVYLFHAKEGLTADPVVVIRQSLVKLLHYYYPMAGGMGISVDGKLQVNYNSQGVVFAEASTDANLADLGDITQPDERLHELVYTVPEATNILDTPLTTVQVTKFKCGGFVFGLANQHSMLDGVAAIEFLKAWSEIARGLPVSTPPFIDRTILKARTPPQIEFPHQEFAEIEDLSKFANLSVHDVVHNTFSFSSEDVDVLKKKVMLEGDLRRCTTFEVLSALIWKSRTMALKMEPEQQTRLYFAVDGRSKFSPPLPPCFMGNGIALTYAMTTSADLCGKPLHHVVKLVQDAVTLINDRYLRSAIDYFELTRARPSLTGSMIITAWSRLPFKSTDFGWGEAWQSGPVTLPDPQVVLFLADGKERKSINVLMGLPPKNMKAFETILNEV